MNEKRICKVLCLIVALFLALSLFTACGSKVAKQETAKTDAASEEKTDTKEAAAEQEASSEEAAPGWKADTSPITLDWYVNYSWYGAKWETANSKYIAEKTGVNLNIMVPTGNEAEKLNTMIASNQLPDVLTLHWNDVAVKRLETSGLVYPLNELAKKHDPYFFKAASKSSIGWYTREDGNLYGYPNFSLGPERITPDLKLASNQTFMVRKDIYEAIGKPDMRTPEGFLNALKAAKEKFPTVNGKPLIPFAASMEFTEKGAWELVEMLQNFLAVPTEKDGQLYERLTDPEYLRWLKTLRKANEMGLLAKDIFIDKRIQLSEKTREGRYFAMLVQHVDIADVQMDLFIKNPEQVYIAVDPPANSNLDQPTLRGGSVTGWTLNMISKNCKDPARAMKFFSYWISDEGQRDFILGRKGDTWDTIDGKDQIKPEIIKQSKTDNDLITKKLGIQDTYWMLIDEVAFRKYMPPKEEPLLQPEAWTYGKIKSFAVYDDVNPPADTEEGIAAARIEELWGTVQPKLLLAASDEELDKMLKGFLDERQRLGWDKLRAYQQKKFEINKKKLGL